MVICEECSWPEMTGLRWYRWLELRSRWCRPQYSHFDTAYQRPKGNLHFSFVIMMSTSYGCAPRYFRHLPAMGLKTTLHTTAPLLYPSWRYPKCLWGAICFTSFSSNGNCWVVLVPPPPPPHLFWKNGFFHTGLTPKKGLRDLHQKNFLLKKSDLHQKRKLCDLRQKKKRGKLRLFPQSSYAFLGLPSLLDSAAHLSILPISHILQSMVSRKSPGCICPMLCLSGLNTEVQ